MFKSIFVWTNLILLFFVENLCATNYYLSTTGTGNGLTSFANKKAYTSFTWSSVVGGDTVYFDGGADSLIYTPVTLSHQSWDASQLYYVNRFASQVVITKGRDPGHNGKVIFQNPNPQTYVRAFFLSLCTNIKLTGLTFNTISTVDNTGNPTNIVGITYSSNIVIDNCQIVSNGIGTCLRISADTNITITNNLIEVLHNNYTSDADCIFLDQSGRGAIITGNTIINGKTDNGWHPDLIQLGSWGGNDKPQFLIANNLMLSPYPDVRLMTGLNTNGNMANNFIIYNNILVLRGANGTGGTGTDHGNTGIIFFEPTSSVKSGLALYNNTIITKTGYQLQTANIDTLIIKNNFFYSDSSLGNPNIYFAGTGLNGISYKNIDYNRYYKPRGYYQGAFIMPDGSTIDYINNWRALGYDTHGDTGAVAFSNKYGTNKSDYSTLTGNNLGTPISTFSTDIFDTPRPQGSGWDIGAVETKELINNNPVPTQGSMSPNSTQVGSTDLVITVTGTNFISASIVQYNGSALVTKYVSATSLTATIPAALLASAGTGNITVFNPSPGGGTSGAKTFTITAANNPTPNLGSISPTTTVAGSTDLVLMVTGTNFISSSIVQLNGSSLSTKYISATSLTATIPTALLASAGTANITVVSPLPGGGTTTAKTFTITAIIGGGGTIPVATLKLTALLESYYVAGGTQMTKTPWVTIELHNANAPYTMVDSNSAVLSTAGFGTFIFTKAVSGTNYFLVVKSMNTVETWSANALSFTSSLLSYDFTTAVTQAYTDGNNPPLSLHNGKYCIYSGDLNQDGYVNRLDYTGVDSDNANLAYHPVNDLNGDGYVTIQDDQPIDNNNLLAIHKQTPAGASGISLTDNHNDIVQKLVK